MSDRVERNERDGPQRAGSAQDGAPSTRPKDPVPPAPDAPDELSPGRALDESLGAGRSQRVGDSGPVANPIVSFPEEAEGEG
jgi:hypothetical protein